MLTTVSTLAAIRAIQKRASRGAGKPPILPSRIAVATSPTATIAAEATGRTTQAAARGGRATCGTDSVSLTVIVTVAAGFYYYLKVVRAMYWNAPGNETRIPVAPLTAATIAALTVLIFVLGIYPQPVFNLLRNPSPHEVELTKR